MQLSFYNTRTKTYCLFLNPYYCIISLLLYSLVSVPLITVKPAFYQPYFYTCLYSFFVPKVVRVIKVHIFYCFESGFGHGIVELPVFSSVLFVQ